MLKQQLTLPYRFIDHKVSKLLVSACLVYPSPLNTFVMPGTGILYDDWKDYDKRKSREKRNSSTFLCNEAWEVGYLISKIRKHHPFPEAAVREAIRACCLESLPPQQRDEFV